MRTPHGTPPPVTMNHQEAAWAGEHGNAYNRRAPGNEEANYHLFKRALFESSPIKSILELGAGTGANVRALQRLMPYAQITAVEINRDACQKLQRTTRAAAVNASVLDWQPVGQFDLVLTKGLLIHIAPVELKKVYDLIFRAARHWILICEYYNPQPVSIPYRGRDDLLWKRDFAGDLLDRYQDLRFVDSGFAYRRSAAPQDDITYFLLEKKQ